MELTAILLVASLMLQTAALRVLLGHKAVHWPMLAFALSMLALGLGLSLLEQLRALFVVGIGTLAVICARLAWIAFRVSRQEGSGSAAMMAWSQAAMAVALLARGASVAGGLAPYQHGSGGPTFVVLHASVVLSALYGSLGFVGLMLDITRRASARSRDAQVAETARREAAEQTAHDLRTLLQERDALSAEREKLLQLLAHEIRQPLHNASGALQAAGQALRPAQATGAGLDAATQRLARAEAVLGDVRAVLDNTLAAATLLSRSAPLAVQDIDLDFLIDLTLGDLDPAQRARVQVQWQTDLRHVEVEPGLLRLALRNLLVNAFSHGGPGVSVQLQVAEQAQPPALLLQVVDDGPGLSRNSLDGPADGASTSDRRPGLGLSIVRQVAALHGGRLELHGNPPQGLQAVLVLPLPAG